MWIVTLLRALLWSVFFVLHTAVFSTVVIVASYGISYQPFFEFIMKKVWSRWSLALAGVDVEVRGAKHLEPLQDKGCLFLFSHSSHIDILVLFGHLPKQFMFGSKIELFSVPFFGPAMRRMGVLPIARDNLPEVMKVYEQARERIKNGASFALAPEGTRQRDCKNLGPFKKGPFHLAIQSEATIVPVLIAGAGTVLPKGRYLINLGAWRRKVILQILPSISVRGLEVEAVPELVDRTRGEMVAAYAQLNQELDSQRGSGPKREGET